MGVAALKVEPDKAVVELLENVLERAKAGEIVGVVVLGETTGRCIANAWAGEFDWWRMIGAIEDTKHRLLACSMEEGP